LHHPMSIFGKTSLFSQFPRASVRLPASLHHST
jgi:hypothetical protein